MLRPVVTALLFLAFAAVPASAQSDSCTAPFLDEAVAAFSRTDHQPTGNRVAHGCGPLLGDTIDVQLDGRPLWVLPDPVDRGTSWYVVLDDGHVGHVVAEQGVAPYMSQAEHAPLPPGEPPLILAPTDEPTRVVTAGAASVLFPDPLPGTRVTEAPSGLQVALTGPTDRYAHGVLGDELEASAITMRDDSGGTMTIDIDEPDVIEGISAMLVDLTGDPRSPQIMVTLSNVDGGARLGAYDLAGEPLAESEPIGQGYRWLHQIGGGPLGPAGETEVIAVRTPHIGGIVEAYRLIDDRLELVASLPGYSSHQLGSTNLDMALLADLDGDGRLEVVVPDQGMTELAVLARTADGFEQIDVLPLDGDLASNVAATASAPGNLVLAAGTEDGRRRIFR